MSWELAEKTIEQLFRVKSGDYHAISDLEPGDVPLISCGDANNGFVGYFDVPSENRYQHRITVAYNGLPLLAKFHPYEFGAKDDVAVLIPHKEMEDATLFYVAAVLNAATWRYGYGRKCYRAKLQHVRVPVPVTNDGSIDESAIEKAVGKVDLHRLVPARQLTGAIPLPLFKWGTFRLLSLFDIDRGDFHSIAKLSPGEYRTVSRITEDNGTVGYFDLPEGAKVYPSGSITVSTVGGDAFVQLGEFIATDNVIICRPKIPLRIETLFFIAFILNGQRWRYSYGRQCYKAKFETMTICLPVTDSGDVDETIINQIVRNTAYWSQLEGRL